MDEIKTVTVASIAFSVERNGVQQKIQAETDFKTIKVNGKEFPLTVVPSRYGADYWTNNPATKVISKINGTVDWWLISVLQLSDATQNGKRGK